MPTNFILFHALSPCHVLLRITLSLHHAVPVCTVCDGIHVTLSEVLHPLLVQLGKTALHEAAVEGNAEMVAYMMEQVNPNVDARDLVGGWVAFVQWLRHEHKCVVAYKVLEASAFYVP